MVGLHKFHWWRMSKFNGFVCRSRLSPLFRTLRPRALKTKRRIFCWLAFVPSFSGCAILVPCHVARPPLFLVRFLQYFFNKHGRWEKSKQQKGKKQKNRKTSQSSFLRGGAALPGLLCRLGSGVGGMKWHQKFSLLLHAPSNYINSLLFKIDMFSLASLCISP